MRKLLFTLVLAQAVASSQPKNVLYVTHSAGFRHDSLPVSQDVLRELGVRSGKFAVTATEDLSTLNDLGRYSAVVFFTSGELALSDRQKQGLLDFVRSGGGFAGIHSGTDTLYTWPEYGDLIGGRFDGHPWTQEVRIDIEDSEHPAVRGMTTPFSIVDEIYQFREFSRERVRVLMTLDTTSVDLKAPGVNRRDNDFALAWTRLYGSGRVFYTALGHFDSTWRDPRFQQMLQEAMLWITGQTAGDGQPRPPVQAAVSPNAIGNAATMQPAMTISPGSYVSIYGTNLTTGATLAAGVRPPPFRLAGTRVLLNGVPVPVVYASPTQLNVLIPLEPLGIGAARLTVEPAGSAPRHEPVTLVSKTPGVFTATVLDRYAVLWATGLGAVEQRSGLDWTVSTPRVTVNGVGATLTFSGLAPGWPGLYQVNIEMPAAVTQPYKFDLSID
jgi:type 1 glutamine amidotransferase